MSKNIKMNKPKYKNPIRKSHSDISDISGRVGFYVNKKHKKLKRLGKECIHYIPEKLTCKLTNKFCKDSDTCPRFVYITEPPIEVPRYNKNNIQHNKEDITHVGITAIVLSDNRKCTNESHPLIDILAKLRISTRPIGAIITYEIPAAYCKQCDLYFILKSDFKIAKEKGIILCPIIDRTQKYLEKHKKQVQTGSESKIHQLGYNVIKGNGYTNEQRHVVLANIDENTNISRHEIKSLIIKCIAQHKNQPNYIDSVKAWQNDLEFISNYRAGDLPGVNIDKIILKYHK